MRFFIIFLMSQSLYAQTDFSYGTSMRSYPSLGGSFNTDIGYSYLLRGAQDSYFKSIIRANLKAQTSIVVNELDPNLTLYPLSFLGFGLGKKMLNSNYDEFTYYDCDEVRCRGKLDKAYQFAKLALGYGPIISTFNYIQSDNNYTMEDENNYPVAEYNYVLAVNPREETQIDRKYFIGFKLDEHSIFGLSSFRTEFLKSDKLFEMNLGVYSKKIKNMNLLFGVGTIHSSDVESGGVIVFQFKHQILPSLALF